MKHAFEIRVFAVIVFLAGFILNYWINRRKFNRRAMTGLEGFRSYERAWFITKIERLGKILAGLLITASILLFVLTLI